MIHLGSTPSQGHYVTLVNVGGDWVCFDDESVESVDSDVVSHFFGKPFLSTSLSPAWGIQTGHTNNRQLVTQFGCCAAEFGMFIASA